jgi:hypothetical protein
MESFIALVQRRIWLGPLIAICLLLFGFGLGLVVGWSTVVFKPNANDILAAADSYGLNNNKDLARQRLSGLTKSEQERMINDLVRDANAHSRTAEAQRLVQLGQALGLSVSSVTVITPGGTPLPGGVPTPAISGTGATPSTSISFGLLILALVVFFVVIVAAAWILSAKIFPQLRARPTPKSVPMQKASLPPKAGLSPKVAPTARPAQGPRPVPPLHRPAPASSASPAPVPSPVRSQPPAQAPAKGGLGRFVATYALGNDNYDTSFSLETARQEFLGECGMGISETIGEGKPDKVTAFDLWLFDKADVRTVTQILMSEYAYNDHALRAKLSPKGQLVMAEKGKIVELETESLRLKAQVTELVYASNSEFPPNSHFQKLVVEILPAQREAVPV